MTRINTLFPNLSLIPVVVLDNADDAVPLAHALLEGDVDSIEITLRTEAGLKAIEQIATRVPEIIVGSGTILNPQQMSDATSAGAQFHVSPGITPTLAAHAQAHNAAWLAGVANASDIMLALEHGLTHVKLFPASLAGGAPMLKQFASVFPNLRICPTGGVSQDTMRDYAALPCVFAIGGSWLTPKDAIANQQWDAITTIAKASVKALKNQ